MSQGETLISAKGIPSEARSITLVSTPNSGCRELWELLSLLCETVRKPVDLVKLPKFSSSPNELANWTPEAVGYLYKYNNTEVVNLNLLDPNCKIIVNVRDPRDITCSQYHQAKQLASLGSKAFIESSDNGEVQNIDAFALQADNRIVFSQHLALKDRLLHPDTNVLLVSFSQFHVAFDTMLLEIAQFIGVDPASIPSEAVMQIRASSLENSSKKVNGSWAGINTSIGLHITELEAGTIEQLDLKYAEILNFLRHIEKQKYRKYYALNSERGEVARVLFGRDDMLFLNNDSNRVVDQITGNYILHNNKHYQIASAHLMRKEYGRKIGFYEYHHAIVPDKMVVFQEFLPDGLMVNSAGPRPVHQYRESGASRIWEPFYEPFVLQGMKNRSFPVTDTHWTHAGAACYFDSFLREKAPVLAQKFSQLEHVEVSATQKGDLGAKVFYDVEILKVQRPKSPKAKLKFTNDIPNEGRVRWYDNTFAPVCGTAVFMHDSFGMWLFDMVPELFERTIFIHTTIFDFNFISHLNPKYIFCLQAERFFTRLPDEGGGLMDFISGQELKKGSKESFSNWFSGYINLNSGMQALKSMQSPP